MTQDDSNHSYADLVLPILTLSSRWDKTPEDIGKNREVELLSTDDVGLSIITVCVRVAVWNLVQTAVDPSKW